MEEDLRNLVGTDSIEIGYPENPDHNGPVLYLDRPDGEGVAAPIDDETYAALEDTFMLTDNPEKLRRSCGCRKRRSKKSKRRRRRQE